jgi:isohexenylglutaconyl-CoA hydratase
MALETLILELNPPFAQLTLNRPEVKNAMSMKMVAELLSVFESLRENRDIRAVVISGAGSTFCSGGDIKEMAQLLQGGANPYPKGLLDTMLRAVNEAPQVIIAKVQGAAMGGGFGLLCVSDIALADSSARFALPEVRRGLAPALISPYVIARMGQTHARRLMLTGETFGAEQALTYGLIHEHCTPDDLDARLGALLNDLRQCSPNAIREIKKLFFTVTRADLDSTLDYRADLLDALRQSDEGMEGMLSFAQKRPPKWSAE